MRIARRALLTSIAASFAAPAVMRLAGAHTPRVTLKLHHFFSAVSCGHTQFLVPWARKVEAESGGRFRINLFPSMQLGGGPTQLFDQARDGLADIVWAVPANTPGRFPKIEAFELPFVPSRRALVNSRAIQDYAAAHLQDEFRDVHALSFSCRDRGVVHSNRTVRSIEDLKGLRLHVTNRLAGEAVHALGARGVSVPIPQVPMAIAGHIIDGCVDPWDIVPALRLHDAFKAHTDFAESALSTATFVLAMNRAAYERLPRDLKTVIDNNSGQVAAGMAGAMWDREAKAVTDMVRERGASITLLRADDVAQWRTATAPVIAAWRREMKERGIDGGKLLASARAMLERYANEPEPQANGPPPASEPTRLPEAKIAPQPQTRPPSQTPPAKAEAIATPKVEPAAPVIRHGPRKELDIPL